MEMQKVVLVVFMISAYSSRAESGAPCTAFMGAESKLLKHGEIWKKACAMKLCRNGEVITSVDGCKDMDTGGCYQLGSVWQKDGRDVMCIYNLDKFETQNVTQKDEDAFKKLDIEMDKITKGEEGLDEAGEEEDLEGGVEEEELEEDVEERLVNDEAIEGGIEEDLENGMAGDTLEEGLEDNEVEEAIAGDIEGEGAGNEEALDDDLETLRLMAEDEALAEEEALIKEEKEDEALDKLDEEEALNEEDREEESN